MNAHSDVATPPAVKADSVAAVQAAILDRSGPLLARGSGTKPALSHAPGATLLDLRELTGIVEYDPGEYTFTARAGTTVAEVAAALAEHGQYLPFDPPRREQGATLGGTVAAGLSGPRRMRYGGVRDFLIGVRFVDGQGRLVRGGGKVVKNAAGFDLPKLMVGSLGRLGVLTEVSFKVFPVPPSTATLAVNLPSVADAVAAAQRLAGAPLDLEALDFAPAGEGATLWARLGGLPGALPPRLARLRDFLGGGEALAPADEAAHWAAQDAFSWLPDGAALVKVAVSTSQVETLDARLAEIDAMRSYSVGGNLAWIGWSGPMQELDALLMALGLAGLVLQGATISPLIGCQPGTSLLARIKQTLDPQRSFPDY